MNANIWLSFLEYKATNIKLKIESSWVGLSAFSIQGQQLFSGHNMNHGSIQVFSNYVPLSPGHSLKVWVAGQ